MESLNCSDEILKKRIENLRADIEILKSELYRRTDIRKKRKEEKYFLKQSLNTRFHIYINKKYKQEREDNILKNKKRGILEDFLYRWRRATGYYNKPSYELKKEKENWIYFLLNMYPSEYKKHGINGVTYYLFYFRTPAGQLSFHMPIDCEGIEEMKGKSKENPDAQWWGIKGHCEIVAARLDKDKIFVRKAKKYFKEKELAKNSKKTVISA